MSDLNIGQFIGLLVKHGFLPGEADAGPAFTDAVMQAHNCTEEVAESLIVGWHRPQGEAGDVGWDKRRLEFAGIAPLPSGDWLVFLGSDRESGTYNLSEASQREWEEMLAWSS